VQHELVLAGCPAGRCYLCGESNKEMLFLRRCSGAIASATDQRAWRCVGGCETEVRLTHLAGASRSCRLLRVPHLPRLPSAASISVSRTSLSEFGFSELVLAENLRTSMCSRTGLNLRSARYVTLSRKKKTPSRLHLLTTRVSCQRQAQRRRSSPTARPTRRDSRR